MANTSHMAATWPYHLPTNTSQLLNKSHPEKSTSEQMSNNPGDFSGRKTNKQKNSQENGLLAEKGQDNKTNKRRQKQGIK